MDNVQIDWLTVVIAALLNMLIGFVWYSNWLFGPAWQKFHKMKGGEKADKKSLFWAFIVSLIIAYFLAFFEGYMCVTSVTDGMLVGFCAWLGFVATTQISAVIWCKAPLELFAIDTGYKLLSFLVMSGVIGA